MSIVIATEERKSHPPGGHVFLVDWAMNPRDESRATPQHSSAYRPEIDGLRAVAVLAVLIHHLNPDVLPGGFLGVDLFFVISGYVVTASLARRQETSWRHMLVGFYSRRFRRLLPALLLMIAATSVLFSIVVAPTDDLHGPSLRTGMAALIGVSNLYLLKQGNNYFDFGIQFHPFLHTWSLGVEEQFYLVWPILVMLCGVGFRERKKSSLATLLVLTIALTAGSFLLYMHLSRAAGGAAAFYLMPARFWELSAGALVFLLQKLWPAQQQGWPPLRPPVWGEVGLCALLVVGFLLSPAQAAAFKPVFVASTAALLAALQTSSRMGRWLSQPAMLAVGMASYSLYLWHWPLIVLLRWTLGINAWTLLPLLACITLATRASYWVETKFRFGVITGEGLKQPIFLYPLATLFTGIFVFAIDRFGGHAIYQGRRDIDPENFSISRSIPGTSINTANCFLEPTAPAAASKNANDCLARARPDLPTLFLEGDSISHSMLPLLARLYTSGRFNVGFFARGGCAMPYMEPWASNRHLEPRYRACREHGSIREDFILKTIKPGDQLLLVTTNYVLGRQSEQSYSAAISSLAEKLRQNRAGLILFSPLPVFSERESIKSPLSLCFPEWFRPAWAIPDECRPYFVNRQAMLQASQPLRNLQAQLENKHPNISIFNPFPLLCPPGQRFCSTHRNGVMIFNDGIHLTSTGARSIYSQFRAFLDQISKPS